MKIEGKADLPFDPVHETLLKPREKMRIEICKTQGKPQYFTLQKFEYLDLDIKSGQFYVINGFVGSNVLLYGNSYLHTFEKGSLAKFRKSMEERFDRIKQT